MEKAKCIVCDNEIPWFEVEKSNSGIIICGYCQQDAKVRDTTKRRKSYRAKNKKRRNVDWREDE